MRRRRARDRPRRHVGAWLTAAFFAAALLAGMTALPQAHTRGSPAVDPAAVPAPGKGPTEAQLQAALQEQADESAFRFRIDTAPRFESGTAEGNLNILNSVENSQSMYVAVTLDETEIEVYRSGLLVPGGGVIKDKLSVELAAGVYPATATAHILDPATGEALGEIEAAVEITVES